MPINNNGDDRDYVVRHKVSIRHIPTNSGYVDIGIRERKTPIPAARDTMKPHNGGMRNYQLMSKIAKHDGQEFEDEWEFIVRPCNHISECHFAEFTEGNMPELEGVRVPYRERVSGRRYKHSYVKI